MSVVIVGTPTAGKKGKILFSCELVDGFQVDDGDKSVSFNSKQFILLESPEQGDYDMFLVQKGEISNFQNYFLAHRNDYGKVEDVCKLLSHCSNKLYLELKDREKTLTNYLLPGLLKKKFPQFSFSLEDSNAQRINFTAKNGITLSECATILSERNDSGKNSLEKIVQETQKDYSIVNFKVPFDANKKEEYYFLGTEYRVSHECKLWPYPPDCRKKSGFMKLEGYSPANIFHHLLEHNENSDAKYFSGTMKDYFSKVVRCNNKDPLASGNICEDPVPHFIIISENMIVSDSSAAHYIPDGAGTLHILAPGASDNYQFSMMVLYDKARCHIANLSEEQIKYLPEAIDYYIKQVKRKIENHDKQS